METLSLDSVIEKCASEFFDFAAFDALGYKCHDDLCLAFSQRVAQGFASGTISFVVADAAVNCLYSYCYHQADRGMPDFSWRVFEAIEQGEYRHHGDSPEIDPVQAYVVPSIAELLAEAPGVHV